MCPRMDALRGWENALSRQSIEWPARDSKIWYRGRYCGYEVCGKSGSGDPYYSSKGLLPPLCQMRSRKSVQARKWHLKSALRTSTNLRTEISIRGATCLEKSRTAVIQVGKKQVIAVERDPNRIRHKIGGRPGWEHLSRWTPLSWMNDPLSKDEFEFHIGANYRCF